MFENVDEFLVIFCSMQFFVALVYQLSWAALYIIVQILHKFAAHVTKLIFLNHKTDKVNTR